MMMRRAYIAICLVLACTYVHAGGSFTFNDQLLPLLKQKPELMEYLMSTLDIEAHGLAGRIGSMVNPHLGGARVGPYRLRAKPKGQKGDYTLELIFHTKWQFLDSNGEPADLTSGVRVVETLTSVEIKSIVEASNNAVEATSQ